jgi:hypothetical protein
MKRLVLVIGAGFAVTAWLALSPPHSNPAKLAYRQPTPLPIRVVLPAQVTLALAYLLEGRTMADESVTVQAATPTTADTPDIKKLRQQCHAILGAIAKRPDAEERLTLLLDILRTAEGNPIKPLAGIQADLQTYFQYKRRRYGKRTH